MAGPSAAELLGEQHYHTGGSGGGDHTKFYLPEDGGGHMLMGFTYGTGTNVLGFETTSFASYCAVLLCTLVAGMLKHWLMQRCTAECGSHTVSSYWFLASTVVSYLLMLVSMCMNAGVFVAVCLGLWAGYLRFPPASRQAGKLELELGAGDCH